MDRPCGNPPAYNPEPTSHSGVARKKWQRGSDIGRGRGRNFDSLDWAHQTFWVSNPSPKLHVKTTRVIESFAGSIGLQRLDLIETEEFEDLSTDPHKRTYALALIENGKETSRVEVDYQIASTLGGRISRIQEALRRHAKSEEKVATSFWIDGKPAPRLMANHANGATEYLLQIDMVPVRLPENEFARLAESLGLVWHWLTKQPREDWEDTKRQLDRAQGAQTDTP